MSKIRRECFLTYATALTTRGKVSYNLIENKYLQIHDIDGKKIISVYIPEVDEDRKPVYLKGNPLNAYIRKHEGDYKISEDDLKRFSRNAQKALDGELLEDYILEDLNMESVLAFKNNLHSRNPSKNYLAMDNLDFLLQIGAFQIDRRDQQLQPTRFPFPALDDNPVFPFFHIF